MISDEQLSAFLDHELPEHEMEHVRLALLEDASLADRLAALACVDLLVREQLETINQLPLDIPALTASKVASPIAPFDGAQPEDVASTTQTTNVVTLKPSRSVWQYAMAASVLLGVGLLSLSQWRQTEQPLLAHLATGLSGEQFSNAEGQQLTLQLSFQHQDGRLCRQYRWSEPQAGKTEERIACTRGQDWQTIASANVTASGTDYQTASAEHPLDEQLSEMLQGALLSHEEEQQLIKNHWQGVNK